MLRTINLHLFRIGIHRFSTISHPKALDACYGAHWRLLRPDFHWQAVDSFQNTRLAPVETCARRAHNKEKPQKHMVSEVLYAFFRSKRLSLCEQKLTFREFRPLKNKAFQGFCQLPVCYSNSSESSPVVLL